MGEIAEPGHIQVLGVKLYVKTFGRTEALPDSLLDLSLALRRELRESDVTVTALCPAGMPTNPAVIRAIQAQGFMGRVTTRNVGFVASRTIDRSLANRAIYIPGLINLALRWLGAMVPRSAMTAFISRRWQPGAKRRDRPRLAMSGSENGND